MMTHEQIKHIFSTSIEGLLLAIALFGCALHQLVNNPTSPLLSVFWFIGMCTLAIIIASAFLIVMEMLMFIRH